MVVKLIDEFGTKKEMMVECFDNARPKGHYTFVLKEWQEIKDMFGWGYYRRPIAIKFVNGLQFYIKLDDNTVPMVVGYNDHDNEPPFKPSIGGQKIDNFEVFKMLKDNE